MAVLPKKKTLTTSLSKSSSSKSKSKTTRNTASGKQITTKRPVASTSAARLQGKKKGKRMRTFTDKELSLPNLNMITPAGVQKPQGKKKGKVFVDDAESMRTILALVSAEREGQIESKMHKARHLEEIREARQKEIERKEDDKKKSLDELKDGLRRKRTNKGEAGEEVGSQRYQDARPVGLRKSRKKVSFG